MAKVQTTFSLERETKGTYRYQEDDQKMPRVGTLYVKKYTFPKDAPRKLILTLEWED